MQNTNYQHKFLQRATVCLQEHTKKSGFISPQKQGANPGGMREEECGKVCKAENSYLEQGCFEIIQNVILAPSGSDTKQTCRENNFISYFAFQNVESLSILKDFFSPSKAVLMYAV